MRLEPAERTARGQIVPQQPAVISGGDQRLPIGQDNATGSEAGVFRIESRGGTGGGIDFENLAVHAGSIEARFVRGSGEAKSAGRQIDIARFFELHASKSLIGSARSSTRWNVGKPGRSYSAYGSIPSAVKIVAKRFCSLNDRPSGSTPSTSVPPTTTPRLRPQPVIIMLQAFG